MRDEPSIMMIVCDTLRKDVLRAYGGIAKTPNIDALAKDSVVYQNAIAPAPWTFPSHVSLFTGLYPSEHGVHEDGTLDAFKLISTNKSLRAQRFPEYLKKRGYTNTGISNNVWVSTLTGFDRGFDDFFALDNIPPWISETFSDAQKKGSGMMKVFMELLKDGDINTMKKYADAWQRKRHLELGTGFPVDKGAYLTTNIVSNQKLEHKFFKFYNFVEVHEPYLGENERERWNNIIGITPPRESVARKLKHQYIKELEYLDIHIGKIIETLKMRDLYDDTMVILTSDHGQAFNEHGFMYHGMYLYDEIARIPLIIKYPRSKKYKLAKGYQNLVKVPQLIRDVVEGGTDESLTEPYTFSESFGFSHVLPIRYRRMGKEIKPDFMKTRKSVYMDGFKLTLNLTDDEVEEFTYNGKMADKEKYKIKVRDLKARIVRSM